MSKHKNPLYFYIITTILLFFNGIMILFPKEILWGVKRGLLLWYNNVLPTLFPFMVVNSMLIRLGFPQSLGRVAEPIFKRLFNIRGEGAFPVVIGIISGCPLGAKTVCELYTQGLLNKDEAERLSFICNNTGMAFVIGAVGERMLKDTYIGAKLLAVQYLSAAVIGVVCGLLSDKKVYGSTINSAKPCNNMFSAFSESVISGVSTITYVGGFIVLFSVICIIIGFLPLGNARGMIYGILELTNGMEALTKGEKISYPVLCSLIAWGGFSIHAQSLSFIVNSGLSSKKYLMGKLLHSLTAFLTALFIF